MSEQTTQTAPSNDALVQAITPDAIQALVESQQAVSETLTPPPADAAAAPKPAESVPADTPTEQQASEPAGISTKSGKGVIPYQVLVDARDSARAATERAERAERELADANERLKALPAGATQQQQADVLAQLSDEEIAAAEADFPLLAKVARAVRASAASRPAESAPATAVTTPQVSQEQADEDLAQRDANRRAAQSALSGLPVLQTIAASGGEGWERAKAIDAELRESHEYADKPLAERFAEVQARVAKELGLQVPTVTTTPTPAPAAPAPAQIPSIRPNTTSDIAGGAKTGHEQISDQVDGFQLSQRFMKMSDADMKSALRRSI